MNKTEVAELGLKSALRIVREILFISLMET